VKNQTSNIRDLETDNSLQIYPNPVNYELKIENGEWKIGDIIEIFDMNGKRVYFATPNYTLHSNNYTLTIDMSNFKSGNYILRIGSRVARIVKQ
jgi:hypothetical protein